MQDTKLNIIISATAKGVQEATRQVGSDLKTGFGKGKEAVKAFNTAVGSGNKTVSAFSNSIKTMLAGVAGFQALRKATDIMKSAGQAAFNMKTSIAAANREFKDAGSVKEWENTVAQLSKELRIYSDTSLKGAISRTIDMTKRLGLSKDQMTEVIKRSADLGAGKVELEGAIERVTAALRGEAESAEYLGLTLNENYVKAQYEANTANEKSWASLTDLEKAQARYVAFLQQSEQFLGRAAASGDTFAGSLEEIKKEIENSIANSTDFKDALQKVADVLKANSGEIGAVVAKLVTLAAKTLEVAIEWKGLIAALLGTAIAISVVTKLVTLVTGLNAAFTVLTGASIIPWLVNLKVAIAAVAVQAGLAGIAMKAGLAAAAAWGALKIIEAGKALYDWRIAAKEARIAQQNLTDTLAQQIKQWESFKDFKLPGDMTNAAQTDLLDFQKSLAKARGYYQALRDTLKQKAKEKTIFGIATEEARAAQKELATVEARLKEIDADYARLRESATGAAAQMAKPAEAVKATTEQLDEFEKAAKAAYEDAAKSAEDYAKQVIAWEEKIKYAKLSTEDKIRELGRIGLEDAAVWADKKLQAEEKFYAAKEAMAKGDYDLAEKLAKDAEGLYADLATEIKSTENGTEVVSQSLEDTKEIAINGVQAVGDFVQELYTKQKDAASTAQAEWQATADSIKKQLDEIATQREANIAITLSGLESAQKAINALTKDETKHIYIVTHKKNVEEKSTGGMAGFARGGKLSGYGGGDRIKALLEAGEFVIRKEAVKKYGTALFAGLNAMRLDMSSLVRARVGGLISNISMPSIPAPRVAFAEGGVVSTGQTPSETLIVRFQAGDVEAPVKITDKSSRMAMKEMAKEMAKMRLIYAR
jgi:hypothetical protein